VLHHRFPDEHSSLSQVRCVCHSATPAWPSDCFSIIGQDCSEDTPVSPAAITHRALRYSGKNDERLQPLRCPPWRLPAGRGTEKRGRKPGRDKRSLVFTECGLVSLRYVPSRFPGSAFSITN